MWIALALMQVTAQPVPDVEGDLRCIAFVRSAMDGVKGERRAALLAGLTYFIGRVEGAAPGIDVRAAVDELKKKPETGVKADGRMVDCSAMMLQQPDIVVAFDPTAQPGEPPQ